MLKIFCRFLQKILIIFKIYRIVIYIYVIDFNNSFHSSDLLLILLHAVLDIIYYFTLPRTNLWNS